MPELSTYMPELALTEPVPERDAVFAVGWFDSDSGLDTLLKMGNAPHEITGTSIEKELATLREFLSLEEQSIQKTWMIRYGEKTIGAAWIDLIENHSVKAPSIHLMIGDPSFRGRGIGRSVMNAMINYLEENGRKSIFSRHLVSNTVVARLNQSIGFIADGESYIDENGLEWQNIKLSLKTQSS